MIGFPDLQPLYLFLGGSCCLFVLALFVAALLLTARRKRP